MNKKFVAIFLAAAVGLTAAQAFGNDQVFADRDEEVIGETGPGEGNETDDTDPGVEEVEEAIDEDYGLSDVPINATYFPDEIFGMYVFENFDTDYNGVLSRSEATAVRTITLVCEDVTDLTGIEYFTELTHLYCSDNELTSLDISSNTALTTLDCSVNRLTVLDVGNNTALKDLDCSCNSLTGLELGNNSALHSLFCYGNQLETLDVSNNLELTVLTCADNLLTRLDLSHNTDLRSLNCFDNRLTRLDLSHNPSLAILDCYNNRITTLDISTCSALDNLYKTCEHQPVGDTIEIDDEEDGYLCYDSDTVIITAVDMYRLYNPNSGEHFYTASKGERNHLISLGWNDEGIGWVAPSSSNTPVYRLYNPNGGEHHYTTSISERVNLISIGWIDEGIGWYSDDSRRVPLYRQYNSNAFSNNHNYTTSIRENDYLVSIGWQAEGIGWYGIAPGRRTV